MTFYLEVVMRPKEPTSNNSAPAEVSFGVSVSSRSELSARLAARLESRYSL